MQPRLTTIAITALTITSGAFAQIEPLTCHGPHPTYDCRTNLQSPDALAAARVSPHNPIKSAQLLLEHGDTTEARAELLSAVTTTAASDRNALYFLLGLTEARLGNHQAAAYAFGSVEPATFASRYNQAIARANNDDPLAAQLILEALLTDTLAAHHDVTSLNELDTSDTLTPDTQAAVTLILTTAATLHYMNQAPNDAIRTLEQLLKVAPRTPELAKLQATAVIDLLPGDGAVLYTQRNVTGDTRDLLLGRAYAKAHMHEYAQQHYSAATQQAITTSDTQALTEIAAYHAQQDQWPQAARTATEALRRDPTNHQAHTILALELENQGNSTDATTQYQLALTHGADPILTNTRLAITLATAGAHQAAIAAAETALEAAHAHPMNNDNPNRIDPEARYVLLTLLATAHHALGETAEALAYADTATQDPLATPDIHRFAGDFAMQLGDPHTALTHYTNADQHDPNVARATYHAHLQLKQYPAARQAAENIQAETGEILHLIAWTYALEGDTRAAHQTWQRAAQSNYAPATQILERIQ